MRQLGPFFVAILLLGACGTAAPASVVPVPVSSAPSVPASAVTPATAAPFAAFLGTPLIDVRSGERFTLADYKGKVTIVEGMAVW